MKKMILALALGLSLAAGSVQAETISFNFSGSWGNVTSPSSLNPWFPLGEEFYGKISYQSDSAPIANADGSVSYAGEKMTFWSSTLNWTCTVLAPEINIHNDTNIGGKYIDQFVVHFSYLSGSNLTFIPTDEFRSHKDFTALPIFLFGELGLKDDQGTAFSSTSLPAGDVMNLWPMPFDYGMLNLYFSNNTGKSILGTSLTASGIIDTHPTPEPATLLLFVIGLTGLAAANRHRLVH